MSLRILWRESATVGGTTEEASLQVVSPVAKPPTLDTLTLDTAVVRGGQSAQGTVRLTGAAPAGGVTIKVRSSNAAAIVPATVAIQGGSLSASFAIVTRPVDIDTQFEITASYLDLIRTAPFRVIP